ncbi:Uncharacterised protein [Campylobacter geochelonis]|nr:Uncharacterised protein [Campylobacter geochelonis]
MHNIDIRYYLEAKILMSSLKSDIRQEINLIAIRELNATAEVYSLCEKWVGNIVNYNLALSKIINS